MINATKKPLIAILIALTLAGCTEQQNLKPQSSNANKISPHSAQPDALPVAPSMSESMSPTNGIIYDADSLVPTSLGEGKYTVKIPVQTQPFIETVVGNLEILGANSILVLSGEIEYQAAPESVTDINEFFSGLRQSTSTLEYALSIYTLTSGDVDWNKYDSDLSAVNSFHSTGITNSFSLASIDYLNCSNSGIQPAYLKQFFRSSGAEADIVDYEKAKMLPGNMITFSHPLAGDKLELNVSGFFTNGSIVSHIELTVSDNDAFSEVVQISPGGSILIHYKQPDSSRELALLLKPTAQLYSQNNIDQLHDVINQTCSQEELEIASRIQIKEKAEAKKIKIQKEHEAAEAQRIKQQAANVARKQAKLAELQLAIENVENQVKISQDSISHKNSEFENLVVSQNEQLQELDLQILSEKNKVVSYEEQIVKIEREKAEIPSLASERMKNLREMEYLNSRKSSFKVQLSAANHRLAGHLAKQQEVERNSTVHGGSAMQILNSVQNEIDRTKAQVVMLNSRILANQQNYEMLDFRNQEINEMIEKTKSYPEELSQIKGSIAQSKSNIQWNTSQKELLLNKQRVERDLLTEQIEGLKSQKEMLKTEQFALNKKIIEVQNGLF